MGSVVTRGNFEEMFPFTGEYNAVRVTGAQLRKMLTYFYREDALNFKVKSEFFQYSHGCRFVWSRGRQKFLEFSFNGQEIRDEQMLNVGIQSFHLINFTQCFGIPIEEVDENGKPRLLFGGINNVLKELVATSRHLEAEIEGRIEITD